MIDQFAAATHDLQWIHVDVERARRESPFGAPVAHGYLSLSLLPALTATVYMIEGASMVVNYGSDRVRYIMPVRADSRVRDSVRIVSVDEVANGAVLVVVSHSLEIEDADRPALVARTISRVVF